MLALTYCFACFRGGHRDPAWRSKLRMLGPCWHYVCTLLSLLGFVTALHALGAARVYKIQVQIPACWNHAGAFLSSEHALAFTWAFRFSPAACRYVRSTWNRNCRIASYFIDFFVRGGTLDTPNRKKHIMFSFAFYREN